MPISELSRLLCLTIACVGCMGGAPDDLPAAGAEGGGAPTPENFSLLKADGSVDGTHFQENGARNLARFVGEGLRDAASPLAAYLK